MNKKTLILVLLFVIHLIASSTIFAKEFKEITLSENKIVSNTTSYSEAVDINALNPDGFTAIWNTELTSTGSSTLDQIAIPTNPAFTYNYTVDWGDGQTDTGVTGNITHTYTNPGLKTVCISGDFPAIFFDDGGDRLKIIEILQWGNIEWQSMENAFYGCENFNFDAIDNPDLSQTTSLKNMFRDALLFNGIINNWNIITITDISGMFFNAESFNRPLDNWDVRNVTDMSETFSRADLFNEPLDSWNTGSVTTMSSMFTASDFNQNISGWNVSNVMDMSSMFASTPFNFSLNSWEVSNVTNMSSMFSSASYNLLLDQWDVSSVTDMSSMFTSSRFNQNIDNWDVSNVTDMNNMFGRNRVFDQPLNSWNVSSVTDMSDMFAGIFSSNTIFNQPLDQWNVSSVTDMRDMFESSIFNQPIGSWDVSNVTDMGGMFRGFNGFIHPFDQPIDSWDVSSVTNMSSMFSMGVFNQPLNTWEVMNVTTMIGMFENNSVFNLPLNNWNVSSVLSMQNMFENATAFDQTLGSWNVSLVNNMINMLDNSALSRDNYDDTLLNWSLLTLTPNVNLGANTLTYCDARFARQDIIDNFSWTINGDTLDCDFILCTNFISPLDGETEVPADFDLVWNPLNVATGYFITVVVNSGGVTTTLLNNIDVGNTTSYDFPVDFIPGDVVTATVIPFDASGPAMDCESISFTIVPSIINNPGAFKLTYDTTLIPATQDNIRIDINNSLTYDYNIDWGDGQFTNHVTDDITHIYEIPGIYTISIINQYPHHIGNLSNNTEKITSIDQWGSIVWESMDSSFEEAENMVYNATDIPNLSMVTNMNQMFDEAESFNGNINNWDVSNVTTMAQMFDGTFASMIFNQPLDQWDVSNVTNMSSMFENNDAFDQNLNSWDVSSVTNMSSMFDGANSFNQPLNNWDTSSVTNMQSMFSTATAFNQPINDWDVSSVTNMFLMFISASAFDQPLDQWDVSSVTTMRGMFFNADTFNRPLDNWDVSSVTTMESMFEDTELFNGSINNWQTTSLTTTEEMFDDAIAFNQPIDNWDMSFVTDTREMFKDTDSFNRNINNWNVSSVTTMQGMFQNAVAFNQPLNDWQVSNVTNMQSMFNGATVFDLPLDNWDVNSVVDMSEMFRSATLFNQPINVWNVSAVANMSSMFENTATFNQPLNNWDVSSVTLMSSMFESAIAFNESIDNWNAGSVTLMDAMFKNASVFNQPIGSWDTGEALDTSEMFSGASAFNHSIDAWDVSFVRTMQSMFQNAIAYNQTMNSWNTTSVLTMEDMFNGASVFNGNISNWNVRNVNTTEGMFQNAIAYDQPMNEWRVNGITDMEDMFRGAIAFNRPLNQWNIGTTTMRSMFRDATAFNQSLEEWDISSVNNMNNMLDNTALTRMNYDNTLIAWSELSLTPGITLGAQGLPYCEAIEERQSMIDNFGWTFNGDILDCPIPLCTQLIAPINGAIDVPVNTNISWDSVLYAIGGYRVTVRVEPGGTLLLDNVVITDTSFEFPNDFNPGDTVFVTIVPFNDTGDATGCPEESFVITNDTTPEIPECTELTLPLNNATDVSIATDIEWLPVENADGYRIDIGTTSGGTDIVNNEDVGNVTIYDIPNDLPDGVTVFVNITPYNEVGDAIDCVEESFATEIIPVIPECTTLSLPLNGATSVDIDTNISWNAVDNADGYLISISTISGTGNIINSQDVGNTITFDLPNDLPEGRTIFVTIIPYNQVGDAIGCDEESFMTIDNSTPPICTTLSSPINGEIGVALDTDLTWDPISNATGYILTVGTTSGGNDIVNNQDLGDTTSFDFPNDFSANQTIFVTIIPYNDLGNATGCSEESFTTESIPDCTILSSPLNNATDVSIDTDITWDNITNATGYFLTVGTTSGGNDIIDNQDVGNVTTFDFPNDFNPNTTIFITVTPYNNVGNATGCIEESFTTESVPDCTTLLSPLNGSTDVALDTDITWNIVENASGYILIVGTTPGGNDILDNLDVGNTTTFNFPNDLDGNATIFITIIPYNNAGNATGCTEESFNTETSPECTSLSSPLNADTEVAIDTDITWNVVDNATGYIITVGTTSGGNDIIDNLDVGNVTTFDLPNDLDGNATIFVTITPFNNAGNAIGCTEESFQTETSPLCTALSSPINGETGVVLDTDLTWNAINNATGYILTVGTTPGGNDIIDNLDVGNVTTFDLPNDLSGDVTIYITIIPYNSAGNAIGCTEESFQTETSPLCTTLSSPLNGETEVALDTDLTWNAISNATGYILTVGTTPGGSDILDNLDVGNVTTFDLPNDLSGDATIYVTIVSYNSVGNAIGCDEESFQTETSPLCTTLSNPINGATGVVLDTDLTWNAINNATGYILTVGTTSGGNDIIDNLDVGNVTTFNLPNNLTSNTVIYVIIVPYNTIGNAIGCIEESFMTLVLPLCTNLISPLNGDVEVPLDTDLTWNAVDDATGYMLVLGTTPGGNDIIDNQDVGNVTTFDLQGNLTENTTIYVTIIPYNEAGNAIGCTQESFTTQAVPLCTNLISPLNGSIDVLIDTDLIWNAIGDADGYILIVGTTPGGNNILDNLDVGNVTTFDLPDDFTENTTIYLTIIPYNEAGNAIGCTQENFTTQALPLCANLTSPLNGDIEVPVDTDLVWNSVDDADGYILTVGTLTGGNDIVDNQDLGNVTNFTFPIDFDQGTIVFVTITPYNEAGVTSGCVEESFTIEAIPDCTNLISPINGATNVVVNTDIIWDTIFNADGYILTIGTSPGGSDIIDNIDVENDTSFVLSDELPEDTTIYVSITPYNELGNAEGCSEESFTTKITENETKFGFSPDGDGINEFWEIDKIEDYPDNVVSIFNRWGDMVFRIKGYDNNQNVFRGEANLLTNQGAGRLPEGTYFFQIDIPEENNLNLSRGFLVIKR